MLPKYSAILGIDAVPVIAVSVAGIRLFEGNAGSGGRLTSRKARVSVATYVWSMCRR